MTGTSALMERYLDALRKREDFARFYAPDAVWMTMESGAQIHGRDAVRAHIVALHTHVLHRRGL